MTSEAEPGALTSKTRPGLVGAFRRAPRSPNDAIQPVVPPPPPEAKKREHGRFVVIGSALFTLVLLGMGLAATGIHFVATRLHTPGPLDVDKAVVIRGNSASEIADTLLNERVIDNGLVFSVGVRMLGVDQHLHKGEFLFPARASVETVIDTLVEGKTIDRFVTIPEGKTSEEVVAILRADEDLSGDIKDVPREGTLLPDTYKITRGDQRAKILSWMADAERTALNDIWKRRSADLSIHSAQDLVVLASIVEKETSKADERPRIAGVLLNRLQKNMRLQSDPTIIYGLTGGKAPLGHGLTKEEINKVTPYNTYTNEGLPPGPIANPGRAALEAVANPSRTKELYFVADGTGGHVFAETLDQHLHNVARWRQIEADRAAASAAGATGTNSPGTSAPSAPSFGAPVTPGVGFPAATVGAPGNVPASTASPPSSPAKGQKRGANAPGTNGRSTPQAANAPAAPDSSASLGNLASMPLTAAMRAKLEQDAATAGLKLPSAVTDANTNSDTGSDASASSDQGSSAGATSARRPIAFDAVAGTKKDPLNNKTFDLNSPKTVPSLK
ncbi:MAG: endolytic transglycosylase MltG [Hyphomicrobiales bacterium]|nr:endolytic transglycosylase MltG [Hyphomicrobiales bacterium]